MRKSIESICVGMLSQADEKKRYYSLHKAVQDYRQLNSELGLRLFQATKQTKKETKMLLNMRTRGKFTEGDEPYRDRFLNRKKRREILGIQEAQICNHSSSMWGNIHGAGAKRKKTVFQRKKVFEVSEHVKGKFNIKGFAARISHSLGKNKEGPRGLTKMINTDLIKR